MAAFLPLTHRGAFFRREYFAAGRLGQRSFPKQDVSSESGFFRGSRERTGKGDGQIDHHCRVISRKEQSAMK